MVEFVLSSNNEFDAPLVSIVMSVRNGLPFLYDAIQSILSQTYKNFELIIMDNASSDGSVNCIQSFTDQRIQLILNEKDLGLSASLNRGFSLARGKYIARMDADDISLPHRIEKQVHFLEQHPDICLCGGAYEIFGGLQELQHMPQTPNDILATIIFQVPFAHPAVMYRAQTWKTYQLYYDESLSLTQDYAMWITLILILKQKTANLKDSILQYRIHNKNETKTKLDLLQKETFICYKKMILALYTETNKLNSTELNKNTLLHYTLSGRCNVESIKNLKNIGIWCKTLYNIFNDISFNNEEFKILLIKKWLACCSQISMSISAMFIFYLTSFEIIGFKCFSYSLYIIKKLFVVPLIKKFKKGNLFK